MKTVFFINSTSTDAKFSNFLNRVLLDADYYYIDNNLFDFSNRELFEIVTYTELNFVDVIPSLVWLQELVSNYPNIQINLFSKHAESNQYISINGNVTVHEIGNKLLSTIVHNYLKMNFLTNSLMDKTLPLYFQTDMLVQFYEKFASTFNNIKIDNRALITYIHILNITENLYNLSNSELRNFVSGLLIHSNESATIQSAFLQTQINNFIQDSYNTTFDIELLDNEIVTLDLKYFNQKFTEFKMFENLMTRLFNTDLNSYIGVNSFILLFEVIDLTTVACKIKNAKLFLSPVPLNEGQDVIDFIGLTDYVKIQRLILQKFNVSEFIDEKDGSISFTVNVDKFFGLTQIITP